jgi:hypothetical protein
VICDQQPRQAQLLCKSGVVYVNERGWPAFTLITAENLRDAIPLESMALCAGRTAAVQ